MEKQSNNGAAIAPSEPKPKKKMKKGWKIAIISLLSFLGLVIATVAVALWLVLTPARLTSIVNKLSDKFITCENHFDNVDLTFFKTFPYVGLEVDGFVLVNPIDGAPNDTVAYVKQLGVGINVREYLKNNNIEVKKLVLDGVRASLYTSADGVANYDVFPSSEEEDTGSSFTMPELVSLNAIRVNHLDATYLDEKSNVDARLSEMTIALDGNYGADGINADMNVEIEGADFAMSGDSSAVSAALGAVAMRLKGKTEEGTLSGRVTLTVPEGRFSLDGRQFVSDAMDSHRGDLLDLEGKVSGDVEKMHFNVEELMLRLKEYAIELNGDVALPQAGEPMSVDLDFATNSWNVNDLLAILPSEFTGWRGKMKLDADAELTGKAKGQLGGGKTPLVTANLKLKNGRFEDRSILPYSFTAITADLDADLDLNDGGVTNVDVKRVAARTGRNDVELAGHVADLMGAMNINAALKGNIFLADAKPMMPSDMNLVMDGKAKLNLKVQTNLNQLQKTDFAHMKLAGDIALSDLDVDYDTIYAKIPQANINVQLPSRLKRGLFDELLSATLTASSVDANLPNNGIVGKLGKTSLKVAVNNIFDTTQPLRVVCDFDMASLSGSMDTMKASVTEPRGTFAMLPQSKKSKNVKYKVDFNSSALHCEVDDSTTVDVAGLSVKGGADYDPSRSNTLWQWSPNLDVDFKRGYIDLAKMAYVVQIPDIKFNYKPERCEIASANVVFGNSDFYLSGAVTGLEKWLSHEEMLKGDLYLTSNYTNVDDLMETFSGMGSDADTLEAQRKADNVDTAANPFIVPRDVDFTLHTRIKEARAFENDIREVAGDVQIRDGVAVLNQVGFVCKAARMQLTGMYRTPRVNHIFVGMDFHLLDINIQELVKMIPYVDTLVPMLGDLEGGADFHLCAETYVNAFYKPKMSTLRAAAALSGQNLVVLDNKDIDRIAKLLQLKNWREDDTKIHVDSLDITMSVFRNELVVDPFLLSLHKYDIVAEGRHDLDNNYDYHVELVRSPVLVRLAVDVLGTMPKLNFDLSPKLRYKNLYRPSKRDSVDKATLRLKENIRKVLEANVKDETRDYQGL